MKTPSWIRVPVMPEVDDRLHEAFPDTTSGVRNVAEYERRQGMKGVGWLIACIAAGLIALALLLIGVSANAQPTAWLQATMATNYCLPLPPPDPVWQNRGGVMGR